jgi:flagellin
MSLGVLTNISAIYAENNLNQTQASLQTTLQQLSSGSRINSGADDAAGLAVVDGLQANEAALTQSSVNATDGVGLLQTADGALSQVNNLLNRAVTLATEAANGTLDTAQVNSANAEYQNIITEIGDIGSTTNFNGNSVFTNNATSLFVSDGTGSGTDNYDIVVGQLSQSSIGQTQNTTVTSAAIAPLNVAPNGSVTNTAGVYTLAPAASGDTLQGNLSFSVGATGTVTNIAVAAGTTQSNLEATLNANTSFSSAGLVASINGSGNLVITGPTSGANAIANAVSFNGTSLIDSTTNTVTPTLTTKTAPTSSSAAFTLAGQTATTDTVTPGGTVSATFNGNTYTYTVGSGITVATLGAALNTAFSGDGVSVSQAGAVLTFTGTSGVASPITTAFNIADTTNSTPITSAAGATSTGVTGVAPIETFSALSSNTDTYAGTATFTYNGGQQTQISLSGLTGAEAATAINNNATLQSEGVSAAYSTTTKELVVTGNPSGNQTLTETGTIYDNPTLSKLTTTSAAAGSAVTGATTTIALGSNNDTVGGTLALVVGTSGLAKDNLSLTIRPGTTGLELANQINSNVSFALAGVTAAYSSADSTVTLTGPVGTTNTISTTGTTLTDTSSAYPTAGTSLATQGVSSLTQSNASAILSTVTTAIQDVAYQRGILGAQVNQLTAASNVATAESTNLTAASSALDSTDYGAATSNLAKYQVLSQTGIAALAQANSVQQEVLKLLQ